MQRYGLVGYDEVVRSIGRRTLGPEELAGDVELLAANDNDLLAVEELLGDGTGETSEKVAWWYVLLVPILNAHLSLVLRTLPVNHDDRLEAV